MREVDAMVGSTTVDPVIKQAPPVVTDPPPKQYPVAVLADATGKDSVVTSAVDARLVPWIVT